MHGPTNVKRNFQFSLAGSAHFRFVECCKITDFSEKFDNFGNEVLQLTYRSDLTIMRTNIHFPKILDFLKYLK